MNPKTVKGLPYNEYQRQRRARLKAEGRVPIIKGMTPAEYSKKRREQRIAQGLCSSCGQRPPAFLSAQCQPCLDLLSKANKQRFGKDRIEAIKKRHAFFNVRPRKQQAQS